MMDDEPSKPLLISATNFWGIKVDSCLGRLRPRESRLKAIRKGLRLSFVTDIGDPNGEMERPTSPAYGGTHSYRTGCHHGYVATTGSCAAIGLVVVGAVFVVYGLASAILAITDFRHWVSTR